MHELVFAGLASVSADGPIRIGHASSATLDFASARAGIALSEADQIAAQETDFVIRRYFDGVF